MTSNQPKLQVKVEKWWLAVQEYRGSGLSVRE